MHLMHEYVSVIKNGQSSYGGNQLWSCDSVMQKCGCGVVAAADLLLYLARSRSDCAVGFAAKHAGNHLVEHPDYEALTDMLNKKFFPLMPPVGMNGLVLTVGMNMYFSRWRLPLKARWGVSHSNLWDRMEQMLNQDIPVIFAVGPNFPFVWQNHRLCFYTKTAQGYTKTNSAKAHYVVLTGMDEKWLEISSWGKRYYIKRQEFSEYSKKHSLDLLSNMLYITNK